jgi:tetratricopeptide (TPR) repeat protein
VVSLPPTRANASSAKTRQEPCASSDGKVEPLPCIAPNMSEIIENLAEGGQFSDMSREQQESFYDLGCSLAALGNHSDAIAVFLRLCLHDSGDRRFWMGLGDSLQGAGNLDKAIDAYGMAELCGAQEALAIHRRKSAS